MTIYTTKTSIFIKPLLGAEIKKYSQHLSRIQLEKRVDLEDGCVIGGYNGNLDIVSAVAISIDENSSSSCMVSLSIEDAYQSTDVIERLIKHALLWCKTNHIQQIQFEWFMSNEVINTVMEGLRGDINSSTSRYYSDLNLNIPNFMTTFKKVFNSINTVALV